MSTSCHPSHEAELKRLKRMQGQLQGIQRMIEERRYCPDILVQLRAVQSAAKSLQAEILKTHLQHCVREAFESKSRSKQQQKVDELIDLLKRW